MDDDERYAGYIEFLREIAGIPESALPPTSKYLIYAYLAALDVVNDLLNVAPYQYNWAVYNLATDSLINWCPDVPPSTYFVDLREKLKINQFLGGIVTSSSDEGTSTTLTVPDAYKNFTIGNINNMRTKFGRDYLAVASAVGSLWGVS